MSFGIVLKEKEFFDGLTIKDVNELFPLLDDDHAYPIEIYAKEHECSAMGFISTKCAEVVGYDYTSSGALNLHGVKLHDFVASILDDMDNETENHEYEFGDIKIYLNR